MSNGVIMFGNTGPTGSDFRARTRIALYGLITLRKHYNGLIRFVTDSVQASMMSALAEQLDIDVVVLPHRSDFIYSAPLNMLQHCGDVDEWVFVEPFTIFFKDVTPAFAHTTPVMKPIALAPAQKDMVAYVHMKKGKTNKIDREKFEGRSNARFAEGSTRLIAFRPDGVAQLFQDWRESWLAVRRITDATLYLSEVLNAVDHDDLITLLPSHVSRKVQHLTPVAKAHLQLDEVDPTPALPANTVSLNTWGPTLDAYWQAVSTPEERDQLHSILQA